MPTVRIPVIRFRQHHMGATERDFLHCFAEALRSRGFKLAKDARGRDWVADPPLTYSRDTENLTVTQDVGGRVDAKRLTPYLDALKAGNGQAISALYALLVSEGDDRSTTLASLSVDTTENALYYDDTGTPTGRAGSPTEPDVPMMTGEKLAERMLCRKALVLFGVVEEAL